jgi:hypothetical protein
MKHINQYLPIILIIALFVTAKIGYDKLLTTQAENRAIYERTRNEIEEGREIYLNEIKELKTAISKQDSMLIKYEKQLKYLEGQNEALYSKYNSLPPITLPDL